MWHGESVPPAAPRSVARSRGNEVKERHSSPSPSFSARSSNAQDSVVRRGREGGKSTSSLLLYPPTFFSPPLPLPSCLLKAMAPGAKGGREEGEEEETGDKFITLPFLPVTPILNAARDFEFFSGSSRDISLRIELCDELCRNTKRLFLCPTTSFLRLRGSSAPLCCIFTLHFWQYHFSSRCVFCPLFLGGGLLRYLSRPLPVSRSWQEELLLQSCNQNLRERRGRWGFMPWCTH